MDGKQNGMMKRIATVCTASFFAGALTRRYRRRKRAAAALLAVIFAGLVAGLGGQVGYAVYLNGEEVGNAGSRAEVWAAVTNAEEKLAQILGYEYPLEEAVSVGAELSFPRTGPQELESALIDGAGCVTELYALEVDGRPVGAMGDPAPLEGLLRELLDAYTTEYTASIRFVNQVWIGLRYVSADIPRGLEEIRAAVAPEGGLATSLVIETTEQAQRYEEVPCDVREVFDDALYEDEAVSAPGTAGLRLVTENVTLLNGVEQSRFVMYSVVTREPVSGTLTRGTKERPLTASVGRYIWPVDGVITSNFGNRSVSIGTNNHRGLDIAGGRGQIISAADGGEVILAERQDSYGNVIKIQHDNGDATIYAHLDGFLVSVGERVYQGQEIGEMGDTGVTSGVHLHFEIRKDGGAVNPLDHLP